jgi:hypothetical protein
MATRDPFETNGERGEVDRASLDATERLRARLSGQPAASPARRPRSSLPWVIAGGLFVFTAGMIANPWFEAAVRDRLPFAQGFGSRLAEDADLAALQNRFATIEKRLAAAPAPVERLARTEARIETSTDQIARDAERIDKLTADLGALSAAITADRARGEATAALATSTAARAEAMLTLIMVRRTLEAGRPLGALDTELRRAFEPRYPRAVTAIVALGAAPVSRQVLTRDFAALRPAIGASPGPGARVDWWTALGQAVSAAVTRPETPARPADVAASALARGDLAMAAAQLRRLPGRQPPALAAWLLAADRLVAGEAALGVIEAGTLLPAAPMAAALR